LESLVRAGNLYLSVRDVIALVLENNLDIAVQRYSPFLAREMLRRTEGGGLLRSVDTPIAAGPTSVSTAGISVNANGLAGGAGLSSGGGIVTQIGPVPPNLDPQLYIGEFIGHNTVPETNLGAGPDYRPYHRLSPDRLSILPAVHYRHFRATYFYD
jgi:outer membrane protein